MNFLEVDSEVKWHYFHCILLITRESVKPVQIQGEGSLTLLHDGKMERSYCRRACKMGNIIGPSL